MRELVRIKSKFHIRENVIIKNLIPFSNNDNNYLFYNTPPLSFISRNKKRVIK